MKSGTILHDQSERDVNSQRADSFNNKRTESYKNYFGDALAGTSIHAALAGSLEF